MPAKAEVNYSRRASTRSALNDPYLVSTSISYKSLLALNLNAVEQTIPFPKVSNNVGLFRIKTPTNKLIASSDLLALRLKCFLGKAPVFGTAGSIVPGDCDSDN
jgi:hypothetical protein